MRVHLDVARVHPLVEEVDDLALAGAVDPAREQDDRELGALERAHLRVEELRAELRRPPCRTSRLSTRCPSSADSNMSRHDTRPGGEANRRGWRTFLRAAPAVMFPRRVRGRSPRVRADKKARLL